MIARFDGFVAKFMGDGILAYFGFPRAHEDDAERAVQGGTRNRRASSAALQTRAGEKLQVRIGIATGLVVVGDLVGKGAAQEQAVVGDTPNLAARLQALAEPDSVVVAGATRRLLRRPLPLARSRPARRQGFGRAGRGLGGRGRVVEREPVRGRRMRRGSPASSGARRRARCCATASSGRGKAKARSC